MSTLEFDGYSIETLFSATDIAQRVNEISQELTAVSPQNLLVVPILKGSFMFAADLLRACHGNAMHPHVDFMMLASYRDNTISSGTVSILRDITADVKDRDVLLIDDILESGRTLAFAKDLLTARGASRVFCAVLLDKAQRRAADIKADFTGFDCPDHFVVGYGMDMANSFRELPFVGHVIKDDAAK